MNQRILFQLLSLTILFSPAALAADPACHSQAGRVESARQLIAQSKKFQLNAKQYHLRAGESVKDANKLKGQADKLNGAVDANSPKEFQASLNAFKDHAKQYRAHLEKVERDLGYCKATEAEYQRNLKQYTLHTEKYHVQDIRPPHICGELQLTVGETNSMANSMRVDAQRVNQSERELAASEAKLKSALDANKHASEALGKRNVLQEEERKLAGEFARLKTEYELLEIQRSALVGSPLKATTKSVTGKVKH